MTQGKWRALPAVWMRGGTSKGLFFLERDLPQCNRAALFARLLGSPDAYGKQIDGLGGASSSTSKIVVLSQSTRADCDVDFWFAQVDIASGALDVSGTCGNLSAAVGPFAVWGGLCRPEAPGVCVRVNQLNTQSRFNALVPCDADGPLEAGEDAEDGVPFDGAGVGLEFFDDPQSAKALFVGNLPSTQLTGLDGRTVRASLVRAGNPTVFVRAADLGLSAQELGPVATAELEHLRCQAAVQFGLAKDPYDAQLNALAVPKIAWLAGPQHNPCASGKTLAAHDLDICARILSMGQLHHAFTGTGAIALAAAARVPGSVVHDLLGEQARAREAGFALRIGHASGLLRIDAQIASNARGEMVMRSASLARTARRLMSGQVYYNAADPQLGCC